MVIRNLSLSFQQMLSQILVGFLSLAVKRFKDVNSFMTGALSCRDQFIALFCKLMDWFLNDRDLRHERVK